MTLFEEELKKLGYTLVQEMVPPVNQPVYVVTKGYRCLALYNENQKWISPDGGEELQNVIGWASWPNAHR